MMTFLSAAHFKSQSRAPISAMPSAVKLTTLLAETCSKTLGRFCSVSWRVAFDRIEETSFPPSDAFLRGIRFESAVGSLTAYIVLDRPVISAFMEAVMGGSGSESFFDIGERPLSSIEAGALAIALGALAEDIARTLSSHFGRPFSHFNEDEPGVPKPTAQERATFRYLVNVFGYSGEIRISIARSELAHQIESGEAECRDAADNASHQQLQRQVGKSEVEFTVSLGSETLSVEEIAGLRPGQLLALSSTVATPVKLWSGGVAAFEGSLARSGDHLAVNITSAET